MGDGDGVSGGEVDLTDGRRRRGARSREAVVEAMLALIREGDHQPSANEIAERAGVSVRSVFRHFDDLDSLYSLAIERQILRILPLLNLGELPTALDGRIARLVELRCQLYEDIHRVRLVGEYLAPRSPVLAEHLERSRRWMREQVAEVFAEEIKQSPNPKLTLDALDAALSWRTWSAVRQDQGRSAARTRSVIEHLATSTLG